MKPLSCGCGLMPPEITWFQEKIRYIFLHPMTFYSPAALVALRYSLIESLLYRIVSCRLQRDQHKINKLFGFPLNPLGLEVAASQVCQRPAVGRQSAKGRDAQDDGRFHRGAASCSREMR